jgi:hypothetical protein
MHCARHRFSDGDFKAAAGAAVGRPSNQQSSTTKQRPGPPRARKGKGMVDSSARGRSTDRRIPSHTAGMPAPRPFPCGGSGVSMFQRTRSWAGVPVSAEAEHVTAAKEFCWSISVFMSALKNPAVEQECERAIQFAELGRIFSECADVPPSKKRKFLFKIACQLGQWGAGLVTHGNFYQDFHKIRRDAKALRNRLIPMIETLEQDHISIPAAAVKLQGACRFVIWEKTGRWKKDYLIDLRDQLSILIEGLDNAIESLGVSGQSRPKGVLSSIRGYPRLTSLIFGLESAAQRTGGRFTAFRDPGDKGTLIIALNEMRTFLIRTDWAESLAEFLPPPNRHPVAKYERILKAARKAG